jgi:hypothetical protein
MSDVTAFYAARDFMVKAVKDELIGSAHDEVLTETPMNRFVAGILYPQQGQRETDSHGEDTASPEADRQNPDSDDDAVDKFETVDTPVSLSHVRYPSAFGLSFSVAESTPGITVDVAAAQYEDKDGKWHRRQVAPPPLHISLGASGALSPITVAPTLELRVVVREPRYGAKPVTLALVNTAQAPAQGLRDGYAWYQVQMKVSCSHAFLDRPTHTSTGLEDEDVASNRLLFRNARNLAIGHGCAVEWTDSDAVTELRMSFIPSHDVPRADTAIEGIPQLPMSGFADGQGFALLESLIAGYRDWIESQSRRIAGLSEEHLITTAKAHLSLANAAAERMTDGLAYLRGDAQAMSAFTLMNRAMYDQRNKQEWIRTGSAPAEQYWRPFQIAFILMNLRGLGDANCPERELADLLWFPTGGGKTEAYLGLIGFAILLRRIRKPEDGGVSVLMRYTLRLLTLQQFERAAGLICALEKIRRLKMPTAEPITLGLWVGQAATPNNLTDARTALNKLKKGETVNEDNPMQLTRCPWCGTALTHDEYRIQQLPVSRMTIICPNVNCDYHAGIPAFVVDSDVYAVRPSLVIGTVDKFAMMAWRADAQTIFSVDGKHSKPDLIVQDELHLISGPLGTMVGLYETAVDAACTSDGGHRPKLVASTATIRRASTQMKSVYAREARQFPPPGLDAGDSFFSKDADPRATGTRQYVGVLAQGVTHTYLLVRTYAALLQAAAELDAPDDVRDAFWTLMGYFNSLRVLGGAAMQVTDDVPAQMRVIANRHDTTERDPGEPSELTSRITSSEIPERLMQLAWAYGSDKAPLNVVLATNMISVGLDVDRLGLMAVMGQPQATAEYIQATSRVGRRNPGLVVVIYNSTRSRDLSHYESFSSYHRALYRQVEPNSATPFSPRARDRGLHGCLVAYARNTQSKLASDNAAALLDKEPAVLEPAVQGILKRARRVAAGEVHATEHQLRQLIEAWCEAAANGNLKYPGWRDGTGALLVQADSTLSDTEELPAFPVGDAPWATLTSLRDVDAVSSFYLVSEKGTK